MVEALRAFYGVIQSHHDRFWSWFANGLYAPKNGKVKFYAHVVYWVLTIVWFATVISVFYGGLFLILELLLIFKAWS